jgi:Spy/CpxP family protein refolding chaperone
MKRIGLAVLMVVFLLALVLPALAQPGPTAEPGPVPGPVAGPGAGAGQGGGFNQGFGGQGPMDPALMLERMLQGITVTDAEKAAIQKAFTDKQAARQALMQETRALRELVRNDQATDDQFTAQLAKFNAALAEFNKRSAAIDAQLKAALSPRVQATLIARGIVLENGGGMGGGMGGGQRGGQGGQGGGQGGGPRGGNPPAGGGQPGVVR